MTEIVQPIPARLKNISINGHVAGAEDIVDDAKGMTQQEINSSFEDAIGDDETEGTILGRIKALEEAEPSTGSVNKVKVGDTEYSPVGGTVSLPAYPTTLPASDVYNWAKAASKPSYTKSEVGLGNVGNYLAVSTEASQGLSETQKTNARSNIGAGTSSFSGSYNDLTDKPTIPSVGNAEVEIQKNGTKVGSFTTNQSGSKVAVNITVPTGTAANKDVPTSGDASTSQVVMGNDSRLTDSRNAKDVYSWAKASSKPTYTASEVGAIPTSAKGAASGVATLDSTGKVPSSQLPSYVDDVLEYDTKSAFPTTGEVGKIYVDKSTDTTWRWSGTTYTQIKGDLAIGTTTGTAADGGVANTHYSNTSNPHSVTKAQVGLGSVVNTGDSATPVSGGTTKFTTGGAYTELAKKVDKVTGKGLSTNDYTTDEKNKLAGIASGAEVNVQSDWNATSGDAAILNKPTSLPASDVSAWAKASTKPSYNLDEVSDGSTRKLANYLPLTGGTLAGINNVLNIKSSYVNSWIYFLSTISGTSANRASVGYYSSLAFIANEKTGARIGIKDDGTPVYWDRTSNVAEKILYHAGNLTKVSQLTNDSGFTTNVGTITGIKMNGSSKGTSGVVDLGTVITAHQDISGKVDKTTTVNGHALSSNVTVTKSDVGLGSVGNFKAVSTEASQGLNSTEKSNARANIGAGTGSYSKPSGGIPSTDLTEAVQTSLGKADSAIQTITAAAGTNIGSVGTPSVTASTSGTSTTLTFNYLKGAKGDTGSNGTNGTNGTSAYWFSGTAVTGTGTGISVSVSGSKAGDMYLNTSNSNVYKATAANKWNYVCNIKGATGNNGSNGSNGVSCTHSWSGTTLTVTSASGTSSANLKGAKGDPGQNATTTSVFSSSANGLAPAASSTNKTTAESAVGNYYLCADGKYRQLPTNAFKDTTYSPLSLGFCYGECSTAAGTTAKTVTMGNYNLVAHGIVSIRFTNAITVASATLNINSKGAKAIYYKGAALGANIVGAGSIVVMQYNGSQYHIVSIEAPIITTSEIDTLLAD